LLATNPKNVDEKNIGNVYEKYWNIIGNFSEKCWYHLKKCWRKKYCNIFLKMFEEVLKKKNVAQHYKNLAIFKKSWKKIVDEINIS
jgi:hypothetical protein